MMLSGLATVPWLTEIVKLGTAAGPELPWVTAQTMSRDDDDHGHGDDAVDPPPPAFVDGDRLRVGLVSAELLMSLPP